MVVVALGSLFIEVGVNAARAVGDLQNVVTVPKNNTVPTLADRVSILGLRQSQALYVTREDITMKVGVWVRCPLVARQFGYETL